MKPMRAGLRVPVSASVPATRLAASKGVISYMPLRAQRPSVEKVKVVSFFASRMALENPRVNMIIPGA
jgi:hypothetical protein